MAENPSILTHGKHSFAERRADSHETMEADANRPDLTVEQILAWADAHHAAHGAWPNVAVLAGLGPVDSAPGESWKEINFALAMGRRGLPGDSSLAELLAERRGAPPLDMGPRALAAKIWAWEQSQFPIKGPRRRRTSPQYCPPLSTAAVLAWADAHHEATGAWPTLRSGPVRGAPFDVTWATINSALYSGRRGFPGGASLARLLAEHRSTACRGVGRPPTGSARRLSVSQILALHRDPQDWPREDALTIDAILSWADAYHAATGAWPSPQSGPVRGAPSKLSWSAINVSLSVGCRSLPGGSSLSRLLAAHRLSFDSSRGQSATLESE